MKANIINNGLVFIPFDEDLPFIEITEQQYNDVVDGKLKLVNGVLTDVTSIVAKQKQISELKQKLADTDYKAIKFAEGQLSVEDYEPIKIQRQLWRDEINNLEANL